MILYQVINHPSGYIEQEFEPVQWMQRAYLTTGVEKPSVEDDEQADHAALGNQLVRHFQCDGCTYRVTSQQEGAFRLEFHQLIYVMPAHLPDRSAKFSIALVRRGLNAVEFLIWPEHCCHIAEFCRCTCKGVDAVKRRTLKAILINVSIRVRFCIGLFSNKGIEKFSAFHALR